jgi:hypothetical protein
MLKIYSRYAFKKIFLTLGFGIERTVGDQNLLDFFAMTRPVTTNHSLVRIGGDADGGYLVPNDLAGIEFCFSPGVSEVANFENDLTKIGVKCFLADYSVESPPIKNILFDFEKKYLGSKDNDIFMRLETWIASKAPDQSEFILQMDIEGGEYQVLLDTDAKTLKKFRILVIEFHGLDRLYTRGGYELIEGAFSKITKHFDIVHIHPNNCISPVNYRKFFIPPVMEFTFLRKDRVALRNKCKNFPHTLDVKNSEGEDFNLPECWYS